MAQIKVNMQRNVLFMIKYVLQNIVQPNYCNVSSEYVLSFIKMKFRFLYSFNKNQEK